MAVAKERMGYCTIFRRETVQKHKAFVIVNLCHCHPKINFLLLNVDTTFCFSCSVIRKQRKTHVPFCEKGYAISEKRISHFSRWDVRFFSHLPHTFFLGAASTCFTYIMICIYPLAMAARKSANIADTQRDICCQPLSHTPWQGKSSAP